MITYGYAKAYKYTGDGTLMIQVRIPSIHGAYRQTNYKGKQAKNYVQDDDLPWYQGILMPHMPSEGEVVALLSVKESKRDMIVIGLTGGSYRNGVTNLGE